MDSFLEGERGNARAIRAIISHARNELECDEAKSFAGGRPRKLTPEEELKLNIFMVDEVGPRVSVPYCEKLFCSCAVFPKLLSGGFCTASVGLGVFVGARLCGVWGGATDRPADQPTDRGEGRVKGDRPTDRREGEGAGGPTDRPTEGSGKGEGREGDRPAGRPTDRPRGGGREGGPTDRPTDRGEGGGGGGAGTDRPTDRERGGRGPAKCDLHRICIRNDVFLTKRVKLIKLNKT